MATEELINLVDVTTSAGMSGAARARQTGSASSEAAPSIPDQRSRAPGQSTSSNQDVARRAVEDAARMIERQLPPSLASKYARNAPSPRMALNVFRQGIERMFGPNSGIEVKAVNSNADSFTVDRAQLEKGFLGFYSKRKSSGSTQGTCMGQSLVFLNERLNNGKSISKAADSINRLPAAMVAVQGLWGRGKAIEDNIDDLNSFGWNSSLQRKSKIAGDKIALSQYTVGAAAIGAQIGTEFITRHDLEDVLDVVDEKPGGYLLGIPGHELAIAKEEDGSISFLDPNYAALSFRDKEAAMTFLSASSAFRNSPAFTLLDFIPSQTSS